MEEGTAIHCIQLIGKGLLQIIVDILQLSDVIMINFALKIALSILEYEKDINSKEYQEQFLLLGVEYKFVEFCAMKINKYRKMNK